MKLRNLMLMLVLVVAAMLVTVQASAQDTPKGLWLKVKCALCHGEDGAGNTPTGKKTNVPDLRTEEIQNLSDGDLHKRVEEGHAKMPSFKIQLTDAQVKTLVFYIRDLGKQNKK